MRLPFQTKVRRHSYRLMIIFLNCISLLGVAGPALLLAEEKMEPLPVIQFKPKLEKPIRSQLQVYPVLVVPEPRGLTAVPSTYLSLYFRDCDRRYSRVEIVSLEAETINAEWKARFKITQAQNDGSLLTPELLITGITKDMLSEEGKKMLQTNETYFLLEPEDSHVSKTAATVLSHCATLRLYLEANLIQQNAPAVRLKHTFDLKHEKGELRIVTYGSGENAIMQTVIVPSIPAGCVHD